MRVLVVGGTGFLGGAIAIAAKDAGHDVTVLSRGVTPQVHDIQAICADRMNPPDLSGFDAVLDTCAYAPDMVDTLKRVIGAAHYVLVSSISVYDALTLPGMDEKAVATPADAEALALAKDIAPQDRASAMAYGAAYGPLKRACEIAADHATVLRLGLIVGAGDYSDRFTWWVRRMDQGGEVPVPLPKDRPLQIIDVRDAARFAVAMAEHRVSGTFNLTGAARTLSEILGSIQQITKASTSLHWRPLTDFEDHGVEPWSDLPLIIPASSDMQHMMNVSTDRALAAGLTCRPLGETIRNVLDWDRTRRNVDLRAGLSAQQETAVLSG